MRRNIPIAVLLLAALISAGCDSSSSGTGHDVRYDKHEVKYVLNCESVTCIGASDEYYIPGNAYQVKECYWYCGYGYKGYTENNIKLVFERRPGGCYALVSDSVGSGICN